MYGKSISDPMQNFTLFSYKPNDISVVRVNMMRLSSVKESSRRSVCLEIHHLQAKGWAVILKKRHARIVGDPKMARG